MISRKAKLQITHNCRGKQRRNKRFGKPQDSTVVNIMKGKLYGQRIFHIILNEAIPLLYTR